MHFPRIRIAVDGDSLDFLFDTAATMDHPIARAPGGNALGFFRGTADYSNAVAILEVS